MAPDSIAFFDAVVAELYAPTSEDAFIVESGRRYLERMKDPAARQEELQSLNEYATRSVRERIANDYDGWLKDLEDSVNQDAQRVEEKTLLYQRLRGSEHSVIEYLAAVASGSDASLPSDLATVDRLIGDMLNYVPSGSLGVGPEDIEAGIAIHDGALRALKGHAKVLGVSPQQYARTLLLDVSLSGLI